MSNYYKLDENRTPVPCDIREMSIGEEDRRVGLTDVGAVKVSTVFLGVDHRFYGGGPPILFETMVFGGALDQEQVRYCTWDEAEQGHADMVQRVRESAS